MYEELLKHKPEGINDDIKNYVNRVVFFDAHYIFYTTKGSKQIAYCTSCKHEFETKGIKHNEINRCPCCYKELKSKSTGRGRKALRHAATFIWYEKSEVNPEIVIARGLVVERDYRVEDKFFEEAFYIFSKDKSVMFTKSYSSNWYMRKSIYRFNINGLASMPFYYSMNNILKAIEGTCLNYSYPNEIEDLYMSTNIIKSQYDSNILKYFDLYIKYPQIEKMIKTGLGNLIIEKLDNGNLDKCINWRAKEIHKIIKVDKADFRKIVKCNIHVSVEFLKLYKLNKQSKNRISLDELKDMEYIVSHPLYLGAVEQILKYTDMKKLYKYINKQSENKQYSSRGFILSDWKDYIFDCKKLNIDVNIESNLMPKDLYIAHQNTIKQIEYKNNLEIMRKSKIRAKELKKYEFKYKELMIIAPKDSNEIIEEGKIQHICVGGYAERHSDGKTNILFIRKVDNPNEPFYTVEIKDNKVAQVRGKRNCDPTQEVKEFMEVFEKEKLNNKKSKVA